MVDLVNGSCIKNEIDKNMTRTCIPGRFSHIKNKGSNKTGVLILVSLRRVVNR